MDFDLFNTQSAAPSPAKALDMFPQLRDFSASLGNTPLVEVPGPQNGGRIFAKLESKNPSGSIKDRVAFGLFCDAINAHDFNQGPLKLLDSSGGNMAKALAHLGHLCGLPVHVVIPDSAPEVLLQSLSDSNAIVTKVDSSHFLLGIIARSQQIARTEPGWTLLSQHLNLVNTSVHQHHTGAEISRQLDGRRLDSSHRHWRYACWRIRSAGAAKPGPARRRVHASRAAIWHDGTSKRNCQVRRRRRIWFRVPATVCLVDSLRSAVPDRLT